MTLAAVAQLTSSGVIAENLSTCISLIRRASSAGAKAIFLPEATDFIAPAANVAALTRSKEARDFVQGIREAAKSARIWVSVGIHEDPAASSAGSNGSETGNGKNKERCYNTQLLVDELGEIRARYRKTHLFDVDIKGGLSILESNTTIPGESLLDPLSSPVGKVGLLTCYDLRFAEPALALRARGAQVLTYPSAFTVRTGAAHWEVLLRARAIETQCWVVAAAQVGPHAGTSRVS